MRSYRKYFTSHEFFPRTDLRGVKYFTFVGPFAYVLCWSFFFETLTLGVLSNLEKSATERQSEGGRGERRRGNNYLSPTRDVAMPSSSSSSCSPLGGNVGRFSLNPAPAAFARAPVHIIHYGRADSFQEPRLSHRQCLRFIGKFPPSFLIL